MIHPFLIGAFPVLNLFARNVNEVPYGELLSPLALVFAVTVLVLTAAAALLRNLRKAGLVATLVLTLLWAVERCSDMASVFLTRLNDWWVPTTVHVEQRHVLPLLIAVFIFLCIYVIFFLGRSGERAWTRALNVFAIALFILPANEAMRTRPPRAAGESRIAQPFPISGKPEHLPDIYYIILDSYARSDVMQALFDFDIRPFLERLEARGFYVARGSTANYCQTPLCLSSSLNSNYLDEMVKGMGSDQTVLRPLIGQNDLMATLRPLGYKFVTFSTGFDPTEHPEWDVYRSPYLHVSEFHRLLIELTPLRPLLANTSRGDHFTQGRDRISYLLDHLPSVASDPAPTFTFAHMLCPHPPFIFGEDGEDISHREDRYYLSDGDRLQGRFSDPGAYVRGYRSQAVFITRRIEQAIDEILSRSKTPPIVILQSDHGSGLGLDMNSKDRTDLDERMSILNAYYFPGRDYRGLYPEISPVNSFRVVLNTFFGARVPLLPDRSYYSTWPEPYRFMDVTDESRSAPAYRKH